MIGKVLQICTPFLQLVNKAETTNQVGQEVKKPVHACEC